MTDRFSKTTGWIIERRGLSLLTIALITAIAIGGYVAPAALIDFFQSFNAPAIPMVDERALDDEPQTVWDEDGFVPPPSIKTVQLSGYDAIMVVETDSLFTAAGAEAMRDIVATLEAQDYIDEVFWLDEVPPMNIFGLAQPLLPNRTAPPERYQIAREKIQDHPLVNGQLLSDDGKTLLLMISINYLHIQDDEPFFSGIRELAEQTAAKHAGLEFNFLVTGQVPVHLTAMAAHEDNQLKYQAIAYGMILLLSMILFRGITAVIVVALAPIFGVFWTMGFIRYFEFQLNPFNDVVLPVLVALVAFTDGVHLMVQIRQERATGLGPFDAAKRGVRVVGLACFLTSLTTAVGFGSLSLANNELVREFGYCCVIGVILSFISVVLTIPLACSTWLGQRIHIGYGKGYIDQNISRISVIIDFVLKHNKWVSVVAIVVSVSLFFTSLTLRPDDKQADVLPPSSEPALALKKLDNVMGGLQQVRIDMNWSREAAERGGDAEVLQVLGEIHKILDKETLLGHPISLYKLLESLPGDNPVEDRETLIDLLPPPVKRSYFEPELRQASIHFRIQDLGIAKYAPVFERINQGLAELAIQHQGFTAELGGQPVWKWKNIFQIVVDLVTSLGTAAIIIFVILAIVYRSLRIGIISILPNLFPLCVAGTYLVLTGQMLEIVTVCAFTCCLGVAVDDTIHFLTRYVEVKREFGDDREEDAIRSAFTSVGTALVVTTVVLVAGFLTVLMSETREHRIFASMGAITVSAALFGDLVFLPAILARFRRPQQSEQ